MSNKMKEVANLLGVELEEEFKIKNQWTDDLLKITIDRGVVKFDQWRYRWFEITGRKLNDILLGKYKIEKLSFKPKMDENYWTYTHDDFKVFQSYWLDSAIDYARKKCGMIFRTEEEAKRERQRVYEELTGKKWEGENNASN